MAPDTEPPRGALGVLALALVLLLWSWSRIEGYPLADVVEDLEWTEALLAGEHVVDSEATRPFGFMLILSPLLLLGRAAAALTGAGAIEVAMLLARLYAIGASLLLVALTMRFAARAGERAGTLAAGILLASNPLLLRWGVEPVSDVTAGIFLLLAAEIALPVERAAASPARRGLLLGLALGAAMLTAYKSIAVAGPLAACALVLAPRLALARGPLLLGLSACLLVQSVADRLYHGAFGESLRLYFLQNMGNIVPVVIHRAGEWLGSDALKGVARTLYEAGRDAHRLEPAPDALRQAVADVTSMQSRTWYATHLHQALTWPGLALAVAGLVRALHRRRWALLLPAAAIVFYAVLMSYKGSKDFRLWLPVLPFVAAIGAFGAAGLALRGGPWPALAAAALLASAVLGPLAHAQVEQHQFAGYWRAIEHVERERAGGPRERVAAGFHWAVYGRAGPAIELEKLPSHLDGWEHLTEAERAESLRALSALDVFVTHQGLVERRAELGLALGRDFEVTAAFFRPQSETTPGPVLVFERRPNERGGLLLRAEPGGDPARWAAEHRLGPALAFDGPGNLQLLGAELIRLPGDGWGWATYHWHGSRAYADLRLLARVTQGDQTVWTNDHAPAYGWLSTSVWPTAEDGGLLLSEGYLMLAPWPAGGSLWIGVAEPDGQGGERLQSALRPSDGARVLELSPPGAPPTPEGWTTVAEGFVRVASVGE
jgi:hypothetical protein